MKQRIVLPLLLSVLAACSGSGNRAEKETAVTTDTVLTTLADPDTIKTDAVTSATSKPNEVLFNGTMIVPPDCQATCNSRIWIVVHSWNTWKRNTGDNRHWLKNKPLRRKNCNRVKPIIYR